MKQNFVIKYEKDNGMLSIINYLAEHEHHAEIQFRQLFKNNKILSIKAQNAIEAEKELGIDIDSIKKDIIESIKSFPEKEYVDEPNDEFGWSKYTIVGEVMAKHHELSGRQIYAVFYEMQDEEIVQSGWKDGIAYFRLKE